jgi:hypothetical protein
MATATPDRISSQRKFSATNLRFKADATLEVMTTFRRPNTLESQVLRAEGSKIIRERVFNKILEAENETDATKLTNQQIDICQRITASAIYRAEGLRRPKVLSPLD